jgi:drug/metabolite transporter (DMT)-like permease
VVGYFKTVIVFLGGWILFDQQLNIKNIIGIILTLIGLAGYTYVKIQEDQAKIINNNIESKSDVASKV